MNNRIMKKLSFALVLMLNYALVNAQDQFTNFGNFQTFSGASVSFFGNFANNGTFIDDQAVTFKGTANQVISGTSTTTFYNFVGNSAIGVTLQQDVIISNSLVLTSGALNLNSKTLTINNSTSTAVSRMSGYILSEQTNNSGKVKWSIGNSTSSHVFPFGTASAVYIPLTLAVTAGDIGNVTVSTYPTAADNLPLPTTPDAVTNVDRNGSDNSANVVDRFWQIDKDGPSGTATVTFAAAPSEVGTITTLVAQRWNGTTGAWEDPLPGQVSSATGVTVTGITSFSPWTMSGNSMTLPIELLSFAAIPIKGAVDLNWKTASEINNDYFNVQRSADGLEFYDIARIEAGSSAKEIQKYNYVDTDPLSGKSYYRLKQTDFDGTVNFSDIRMVNIDGSESVVTAYPNPVTNGKISIDFHMAPESPTRLTVYDTMGKIVLQDVIAEGISSYSMDMTNTPTGVYVIKGINSKSGFQQTIVVK
jgi:hypothetical protein